ncbi:MAG: hypothetical protein IJ608_07320 [Lachnospiraceae bacterium]|nr:hypothetical protein [Lachnospiraceae bacterium]
MRLTLSVGEYAKTPYIVPGIELPVYCMEELCFCIRENAPLLDARIMGSELLDWIDKRLELHDLANSLLALIRRKGSLSDFIGMIFNYTGLYENNDVRLMLIGLQSNEGLNGIERRKESLDGLVNEKKYHMAIRGYEALLEKWDALEKDGGKLPAAALKASLLHNMAVAYTGLMQYGKAAECFDKAYHITGESIEKLSFLSAKRMELSDSEYVAFMADYTDCYTESIQLEKKMDRIREEWRTEGDYARLSNRILWRVGEDKHMYYDENDRVTRALKDNYRQMIADV